MMYSAFPIGIQYSDSDYILCVVQYILVAYLFSIQQIVPFNPLLLSCSSPLATSSQFSISASLFLCDIQQFAVLFTFHIGVISHTIFLSLTYLTKHNILQMHSCCFRLDIFILFFIAEQYTKVHIDIDSDIVKGREAWCAAVHGVTKSQT